MIIVELPIQPAGETVMSQHPPSEIDEKVKVYVRRNGARYVKAEEVLGSRKGQEAVEAMSRLLNPNARSDSLKRERAGA